MEIKVIRTLKLLMMIFGVALVAILFTTPQIGIHIFWNGLIPAAPLLFFLLPGLWRNICPMASFSLLPRRFGLSKKMILSEAQAGYFQLGAIGLLFLIAPLRHVGFNLSGPMTGAFLVLSAMAAISLGYFFEYKSGWCTGLCPVSPVERLYGSNPIKSIVNVQCDTCNTCSKTCADSTVGMAHDKSSRSSQGGYGTQIMYGFFPGFIWGWFQAPDFPLSEGLANLHLVYAYPLIAGLASYMCYIRIEKMLQPDRHEVLSSFFALISLSTYYWFRIPQLIGMGSSPDGMLINLRHYFGGNYPLILQLTLSTLIFVAAFAVKPKEWSPRPKLSQKPHI